MNNQNTQSLAEREFYAKTLGGTVTKTMRKEFNQLAKEKNYSSSSLIRSLIQEYLASQGREVA